MIVKTEAIPLAWHEVSNTSRIVHWFTRDHGRVATLIKGALRPRSPFLGQYDLHATSELLFYSRESDDLHIAKECGLLEARPRIRSDWRAHLASVSLGGILLRCSPPLATAPRLFADYTLALDALARGLSPRIVQYWAEIRICEEMGVGPALGPDCAACHRTADPGAAPGFSAERGGILCERCMDAPGTAQRISRDALALLRRLRQAPSPDPLLSLRLHAGQERELHVLLGRFLAYHLDFSTAARDRLWIVHASAGRP